LPGSSDRRAGGRRLADRMSLASVSIESARLAVTGQPDFRAALQPLRRITRGGLDGDASRWTQPLVLETIRRRFEALLQHVASKGYRHSDFYRELARLADQWRP